MPPLQTGSTNSAEFPLSQNYAENQHNIFEVIQHALVDEQCAFTLEHTQKIKIAYINESIDRKQVMTRHAPEKLKQMLASRSCARIGEQSLITEQTTATDLESFALQNTHARQVFATLAELIIARHPEKDTLLALCNAQPIQAHFAHQVVLQSEINSLYDTLINQTLNDDLARHAYQLLHRVKEANKSEHPSKLTPLVRATNDYLQKKLDRNTYETLAKNAPGNSSVIMKIIGGMMMVIAALIAAAAAISVIGLPLAAAAGGATAVVGASLLGAGFFKHGISRTMLTIADNKPPTLSTTAQKLA